MSKPLKGFIIKGERRAKIKHKEIHGPVGGTRAGFAKRAVINKGFVRSKRKPEIVIIDKSKK
ncbi:MAG: hypothetical protein UT86_C0007G0002 [Candidatus Magasanikbacteria bacterium GW2011_GWC2_40_17]|uniref:Uncharacterized protein n=1 Tax=Candidatus Magasanikbacteria bacterium GW2011_GWA2_42_32 TaxID=1619039 RepID=A0A0G1CCN8_9BACT|nr:MAG: hypothetical protein UT86_C0007G0002 [Candidatus Magasanikbacteria bacterium GW2011_GWC2_40_17]KKS56461.1 MAG: hypothetical protein UV20_C0011G0002 [Candidatus Magasanikbacteria bacterium GW2011_GWA2_42_32]OGH85046.1 MAG: hypothetical protein A2294_01490 [Candidatus Magasanikbacteria bacterium RIFOXYB2_FULL_38_10]